MWRSREVLLATILVATAASCRYLPSHKENGPSAYFDIAAFGDSYTAGNAALEGGGDDGYFFKSPDDPRANADIRQKDTGIFDLTKDCFRNHNNYSEELHRLLGSSGAYINGACTGDTTLEVTNPNGNDGQLNGFTENQRKEVDLVTISIGGNDLAFAPIIEKCFVTGANASECDALLSQAEDELEISPTTGISLVQHLITGALRKVATDFPDAKVVLVGYPLLYEDDGGEPVLHCEDNSCSVYPQDRLENGLNTLNDQQQATVDQINGEFPGRFAFLPLHSRFNDSGLFDHHGINGGLEPWIQPLGSTAYVEEWAHPTAMGHDKIAQALRDMPFVQDALRNRIRADYPKMSLTSVDDQWYALNGHGQLWTVTTDFVQCQLPNGPYKLASWKHSQQLFDAAVNRPPYDDLQGQPGCDLSIPREGDILEHLSDVHGPRYWRVSFGSEGQLFKTEINRLQDRTLECMQRDGSRLFRAPDIDPTAYQDTGGTLYSQKPTCGVVIIARDPAGDVWWASDLPTTDDPNAGNFNDRGTTFTKATVQWMIDCFNGPQYSHIRVAVSQDLKQAFPLAGFKYGITAANCIT
jgi:hypothetical protein